MRWTSGDMISLSIGSICTALAAPTDLGITPGNTELALSWTVPGGTVTGYNIHYTSADTGTVANDADAMGTDASAAWIADTSYSGTATSHTIENLSNGTLYRVRVRAVNSGGEGPWLQGTGTPASTDATLQALTAESSTDGNTFEALTLTPAFATNTLNYTATVDNTITQAKLTPTTTDSDATLTVNGTAVDSGTASTAISLTEGNNNIAVVVTAEDDTTMQTYRVTITRLAPPAVTLTASPNPVTEGNPITITATLSTPRTDQTTIPLTLSPGPDPNQAETDDYGTLASITIPANQRSATGQIATNQDTDTDDDTFTVALGTLPTTVTAGNPSSQRITISDDDSTTPRVSLSLSPTRVAEGAPVTVTATLSATLATEVIIPLTLTPGPGTEPDDYGTLSSITIPANARSATGTISTAEDRDTEEDIFTVALSSPLPAGVRLGSSSFATVTITEGSAVTPATPTGANATNQAVLPELAQVLTDVSVSAVTRRIGQVTRRGAGSNAASSTVTGRSSNANGDTSANSNTSANTDGDSVGTGALADSSASIGMSAALATAGTGASENVGANGNALTAASVDTGAPSNSLATTLATLARQHTHTLEQDQSLTGLLNGSAFSLPLNHLFEYQDGWASTLALWGSGSYRDLNSDRGAGWEGDVVSAQLGLDAWVSDNWLLGVAGGWSEGDIDYRTATSNTGATGNNTRERNYTLTLYTIYPYIAWTPSDRVQLWASGGYGQGELDIETQDRPVRRVQADVDQWLIAGGGSLRLVQYRTGSLHLKVEAQQAWTESDRSADLTALSVKGHTLRATLEANRRMVLATGSLTPSLELGVRHDGGDGDTGTGAIVGTTLRWQGTQGLQLDAGGEALLGRDDYEEWSVWGLWQAQNRRGWSFHLQPRYGREGAGADVRQLWRHDGLGLGSPAHSALPDTQASLDLRLDHTLGRPNSLLVPYSELRLGEQQRLRLGLQWRLGERWDLDLRAERNEHGTATATSNTSTDHSILLEGRIQH